MPTLTSTLSCLFGTRADPREAMRPLWHQVVAVSRAPRWYRQGGVADTVGGRFDMIATVLALVLLRLEAAGAPPEHGVHLTELFVADMDRQLRESGVGDLVVGKKIGRLVSALGGRLGALRNAFAPDADPALLTGAVARNITLNDGADGAGLATLLRQYRAALDACPPDTILAAELPQ